MSSTPVLIAGAGPTGLVLAIWLRLLDPNLKFRIVSDADGPGTKSRAIVVHARTIEYYRQIGIADKIIAAGQAVESINAMQRGVRKGQLNFTEMGRGQSKYPIVLALPQDRHEQILLERFEELKGSVEWNTKVQNVRQEKDHVLVEINGQLEMFQYVVGCDGAHSVVRSSSGIKMEGGTYPQRYYVADVKITSSRLPVGLELSPGDGQMTIVLPLGQNDSKQIRMLGAYNVKEKAEEREDTFEDVRNLAYATTKLEVEHVNWFSTYAVHHRFASSFRDGRICLAGDAAHLHSPVGGQGLNTGIGDASNLAWKIVSAVSSASKTAISGVDPDFKAGKGIDDLLQSYHHERREFAKTLVQTTDTVFTYVTQASLVGKFLRDIFFPYILPAIWKIPAVPPVMYRRVSQIGIDYRNSTLSDSNNASSQIKSGDRIPFVAFDDDRDNHEPLNQPGWQIHIYGADTATTDNKHEELPVRTWPLNARAQQVGLVKNKVYLIRPDGHIGFMGDSLQDSKLEDYIVKWAISA